MSKMSWLLRRTGEAVGSPSQESSPESRRACRPPFEISGPRSLGGRWAERSRLYPSSLRPSSARPRRPANNKEWEQRQT